MLRAGAIGGVAGVAGCLEALMQAMDEPLYRQWLPAPGALEADHYQVQFLNINEIVDNHTAINQGFYDDVRNLEELFLGVEFDHLDRVTALNNVVVAAGEFDTAAVGSEIEEEGYSYVTEYEEYEIYEANENSATAVTEDATINVPIAGNLSAAEIIELLIDAQAGNVDRYHETNGDFEAVTDELGFATILGVQTFDPVAQTHAEGGQFENNVGVAIGWDIDAGTAEFTAALAFQNEGDIVLSDVETWTQAANEFDLIEDLTVESNDALAVVTGTADTADVESLPF